MKKSNQNFRLYRFRSAEALIGKYEELKNGYFYFASKEELNDPMEGFIPFYWQGDRIVWENLFKHYIFCLALSYDEFLFSEKKEFSKKDSIQIYIDERKLNILPLGQFLKTIVDRFLSDQLVLDMLEFITTYNRKVFKDELLLYFRFLQNVAFYYICNAFDARYDTWSIKKPVYNPLFKKINEQYAKLLEESEKQGKEIDIFSVFAKKIRQEFELLRISFKQEYSNKLEQEDFMAKSFFLFDFPAFYVDRLRELAFPNFYYACFMTTYDNPALWGYYADSNKGCCLIFEPKVSSGKPYINLYRREKNFFMSLQNSELLKVEYKRDRPEINFFENIGNLRLMPEQKEKSWYMDKEGNFSKSYNVPKTVEEIEAWKAEYNKKIREIVKTKFPAWAIEKEYRLFLQDGFECSSDKESRKFCYDFSTLKGIAFGVNTSESDKIKIIDLLTDKCKAHNITDFKFYQAEMNIKTGKIELVDLVIKI